jgi:periplasmic protein TonB
MTSHEILKADLLDILFDNRNKQYGAYALRRQYNSRLTMALGIALSSILLLFFFLKPGSTATNYVESEKEDVRLIDIPRIPPKIPEPPVRPTPPPPQNIAQSSLTEKMLLVENPDPDKEFKPIDEIKLTAISTNNVEGAIVPEIQTVIKPEPSNASQTTNKDNNETRFVPLEKGPEFPGGPQAWANFLNRYLQTPADLEAGEKKIVLISFLVDADGSVTGFKVVRSGGKDFDNEVIRVLKKMPKWKPAIQNGHPVVVPFTQPVTFVGFEQ